MLPLPQLIKRPVILRSGSLHIRALPAPLKGVMLALISTALFVFVGALVRMLSERIDVFQILLFRQLVFVVLLTPSIIVSVEALMKPRMIKLHLFRVIGAFAALYLGYITVSNIPLADATAIGFTKVLFVAIISRLFLSESVGGARLITILVGFFGVMLVVRPTFEDTSVIYSFAGIGAALGAAVAVACVRRIALTEPKVVLLTYQAVFVGVIALIPSIFTWQWPTLYELILLLLVGVISSVAQWFGITAYKWGEANVIANVEYVTMIYALLLGYWLFSEIPDFLSLTGALIIIVSAFLPYFSMRLVKRFR